MEATLDLVLEKLGRTAFIRTDIDRHLLRAAMVLIFAWFGWDKWHLHEVQALVPLISHGPLIFWTLPVLGVRGTSYLLGTSEWTFGLLIFLGFWNRPCGILGALGSCATFVATATILPFAPGAWDPASGGFPSMTIVAAFLVKDVVLLAVSVYLLKQDLAREIEARGVAVRRGRRSAPELAL